MRLVWELENSRIFSLALLPRRHHRVKRMLARSARAPPGRPAVLVATHLRGLLYGCYLMHGSGPRQSRWLSPWLGSPRSLASAAGRTADGYPLTCWRAQSVLAYGADVSGFDATPQTPVRGVWN